MFYKLYILIIYLIGSSVVLMIRSNCPKNEFSELYLARCSPIYLEFATVATFGVVLSCRVIAHGFSAIKQRRPRLVYANGWSWLIAHAWFLRDRAGDTDRWMTRWFSWCGDRNLDPVIQGHGRFDISCFWTGHNVGRHDGTPHDGAPPAHQDS